MTVNPPAVATTPTLAPPAQGHTVRKATPADVPKLAQAMTRAFYDDPVVGHWCSPDESRRVRRLEHVFELFLERVYLRHDECYTTDELTGGAFWLPPGKWKLGALEELQLIARMVRAHGRALPRILRVLAFIEARHPHEPHCYLQFIGVEPEQQGRGAGSALLTPVLERCDREGLPAYLEASNVRSRDLYLRHGFEVVEEVALPGGGPPIWRMWREAVSS